MASHPSTSDSWPQDGAGAGERDDGLDVVRMWRFISRWRRLILVSTVVGTALAAYLAFTATVIYRAETVITPVRTSALNAAGSLGGQLGGLAGIASLAGVNLDANGGADREAKAVLQSRSLIEEFIRSKNLIGELLPHPSKPPTMWRAAKEFKEDVITIRDDKRTNLTTLSIDWKDAAEAARWANDFVALANSRMRARAIDESTRNVEFLNKQIAQTNVIEVQRALYVLIENETKTLMLANVRVEYAFTVIDPAVAPERRLSPKRSLYILAGLVAGFAIGVLVAYLRSGLSRLKQSNPG